MYKFLFAITICGCFLFVGLSNCNAQELDADYKIQGEYQGEVEMGDQKSKYGIQVIALGKGKFTGVGYSGGLPGDGWNKETPTRVENVQSNSGVVVFKTDHAIATIENGMAKIADLDGNELGELSRVERKSPTLGKEPPAGAVVLFDGSSADQWHFKGKPARMTDDGLLMQGANSKQKFGSHHLHIEFRTPYKPEARGQARGNSGLYLQGRYEVQMLDSLGLSGEQNECGGIYSIKKPDQNMCFPPMQWQTYDVDFHQAVFVDGKKTKNAWMTVWHNGVKIHDHVELPKKTTAAPLNEGVEPGFIHLQDHGNPVCYRNIWVQNIRQTEESCDLGEGQKMDYLLGLPEEYVAKDKWPLILFLHGAGERGNDLNRVLKHGPPKKIRKGESMPFVVVSPQCDTGKRWNAEALSKLLDDVESKYKIDKQRIYLTGLSMGGYGSWALTAHSPKRFAAVAPICGGGDAEVIPAKIKNHVPVWAFHGDNDRVVPIEGTQKLVDGLKELGAEPKFTIYAGVNHDSWTETYDNPELYKWFMSYKLKDK